MPHDPAAYLATRRGSRQAQAQRCQPSQAWMAVCHSTSASSPAFPPAASLGRPALARVIWRVCHRSTNDLLLRSVHAHHVLLRLAVALGTPARHKMPAGWLRTRVVSCKCKHWGWMERAARCAPQPPQSACRLWRAARHASGLRRVHGDAPAACGAAAVACARGSRLCCWPPHLNSMMWGSGRWMA